MKHNYHLPLVSIVLLIIFGTIYVTNQQVLRMDANDPQIQLAEDTAARLDQGVKPSEAIGNDTVNINRSLAPFTAIYDKSGSAVASSGLLNGQKPKIPKGVLINAVNHDYNAVTWQPTNDVRLASVAVASKDYYVVSARSLTEVEKRENTVAELSLMGLLASMVVVTAAYFLHKKSARA